MQQKQWRLAEILGFLAVYFGFYLVVLGPLIGAVLPGFENGAFSGPSFRPTGDLPDTGRGWLLIISTVPALLGYMYLRARLDGRSMQKFWNPSD